MNDDLRRAAEDSRRMVDAMTPEECLRTARMLRDAKPRLRTIRQREIADEFAMEFEERAASHSRPA